MEVTIEGIKTELFSKFAYFALNDILKAGGFRFIMDDNCTVRVRLSKEDSCLKEERPIGVAFYRDDKPCEPLTVMDMKENNIRFVSMRDMEEKGTNPVFFLLLYKDLANMDVVKQFQNRVWSRGGFCFSL